MNCDGLTLGHDLWSSAMSKVVIIVEKLKSVVMMVRPIVALVSV